MYYLHHWPLLAVIATAILGGLLLLWILFHLFLEARNSNSGDRKYTPLGTRDPRR